MINEKIKKILKTPIEEIGLSIGTTTYLKQIGINTLNELLYNTETSYEEMHKRIFNNSNLQTEPLEIQKYYNEITEYLRYLGIKIKEETMSKKAKLEVKKISKTICKK